MVVKASLAHGLQESVGNLWQRDDFNDCTIVVENTSFKCHRFILSACSGFFRRLFRSQMKESLEGVIHLHEMSKITFDTILNSIYKGVDGLTTDNILDVWSATAFLQIYYLIDECKNFVSHNISPQNSCTLLNHAILYSAQNVIADCLKFIVKNFEQVKDAESFTQLTFDSFHKVIRSDFLAADSEESVLDTILKWVNYKPNMEHCPLLYSGTLDNKATGERQFPVNISRHNGQVVCREEDRKQHFPQLLSACRYLLVKPSYLENLLNNHAELLVETGTHKLVVDALMYTLCVDRRHDCWPEAAVYRTSSPNQHVMVFLSPDNRFMAYNLDRDTVHQFATPPVINLWAYSTHFIATVFDNVLYLQHGSRQTSQTCILTEQKQWETINTHNAYPWDLILTHGNYIYGLYTGEDISLYRYTGVCVENKKWSHVCNLKMSADCIVRFHQYIVLFTDTDSTVKMSADCIVRFHQYIVLFTDTDSTVTTCYYNPAKHQIVNGRMKMAGTCKDMESFIHEKDVYILQTNGTLWKLCSPGIVDFELVSKLWDGDCSLKGCVLYKKELLIFCVERKEIPNLLVTSLPGICYNCKIIKVNTRTRCLPMVLHKSWLTL